MLGAAALVGAVLATSGLGGKPNEAEAANGADFNPGMIISDEIFYNPWTMSVDGIQAFLNERVPTCRAGYTCLKDHWETTRSQPARSEGCAPYAGQWESAARIIYKVAVACGINPQALIVLLEKEQGLVSASAPTTRQYRSATGYGCPDTADCDANYYGFFNQVYNAAWQFKKYRANPSIRGYQAGRTNTILWHPNTACGSSQVYIENQATAGLYVYTPYRPNKAALDNLYGTGDGCSSYGNRNFWRMFTDWFGSTSAPSATPAPPAPPLDSAPLVYAIEADGDLQRYSGTGQGGWLAPVKSGIGWTSMRHVTGAGDLDGDANRDLIAIDGAGVLWSYPTDGMGRFLNRVRLGAGLGGATALVSAGDFNTDGAQDFFVREADGSLVLYANNGTGQFAPKRVGIGWGSFTALVGGIDVDGDGAADVLARAADGGLWLYPGNGRAGWGAAKRVGNGWNMMNAIVSPGDFNSDGFDDLLARAGNGDLWFYPGTGAAGWLAPRRVGNGWQGMVSLSGPGRPASAPVALTGGIGDVTGNGSGDILARTKDGTLWLYPTDGRGSWLKPSQLAAGWSAMTAIFPGGDFDRNGRRDIFARDGAGDLWRYEVDGAGRLTAGVKSGNGWGSFTALVGALDANNDRRSDVLARDAAGRLWLYPGNGAGGFGQPAQIGSGWAGMARIISPGDFDGDGLSDLIAISSGGDALLYSGNGAKGFTARKIGQGWGGMALAFSPGDFDGDLHPDVIARSADGGLWLYPGNGTGGWKAPKRIGTGWGSMDLID